MIRSFRFSNFPIFYHIHTSQKYIISSTSWTSKVFDSIWRNSRLTLARPIKNVKLIRSFRFSNFPIFYHTYTSQKYIISSWTSKARVFDSIWRNSRLTLARGQRPRCKYVLTSALIFPRCCSFINRWPITFFRGEEKKEEASNRPLPIPFLLLFFLYLGG